MSVYKIKRHKLLNVYYLHDQYSGKLKEEYEVVEEVTDYNLAITKVKEYQETATPSFDGLFEDYYKYEHMKDVWGDPRGVQPLDGQLFFICLKEMHGQFRTLFHLCEVKAIQEPHVMFQNYAESKNDKMTFAQFQGLALIPGRDELFIQDWETKTGILYPRNLISRLSGITNHRYVRHKYISIGNGINQWDLPKSDVEPRVLRVN